MSVRRRFAIVCLSICFSLHSSSAQSTNLNRAYGAAQQTLASGDTEGALRQFEALAHAHPEVAEIHAMLGALLFQKGDFAGSLHELKQAKRLKPTLPKLDGLIAMANTELGHHQDAAAPLAETFRTSNELPVKRMSGLELERLYTSTGQDAKAVEVALELQRLFPNDPEVLYHNERIFGNFAFLTVQSLVKVAPDSVWRYQAQAEAQESEGLHDAALASYRSALAIDPNRPGLHYRIGRVLRERARDSHHPEDLQMAAAEFHEELKLDPSNASADYEIGELQRLSGNLPEAKAAFEAALQTHPDFPEANLGLGTVLASLHEPAAALPLLQRAIAADPSDEATWYRLAQVQRDLGHKQEQAAALEKFRQLHQAGEAASHTSERDVSHQMIDAEKQ